MRKMSLIVALGLILAFGLSGSALAAPNLATTDGGTLSIYAESMFGLVYYGGVTYTIADGCGLGIATMLNDAAFELFLVNGTLTLGPVALDIQALTDTSFEDYIGQLGGYLKLDLGAVSLYPGVGMLFIYYDLDDDGTVEENEKSTGDPYFSAQAQFKAGDFLVYGDAMLAFGGTELFMARVGISYGF